MSPPCSAVMTVAADRPQGRPDAGPDPSGPDCGLGEDVLQHLPALRAYARSLCRRTQDPDDLVQETLLRAIEFAHSYQPGTKLRAWLFTIMRSRFYNDCRRRDRERTGDADCVSSLPRSPPSQDWHLRHREMLAALDAVPVHYREALVLVAVLGESYSAAARDPWLRHRHDQKPRRPRPRDSCGVPLDPDF